ncbi:MAG TPA: hypothetical protein VMA09_07100 [Candidatus Binataceae bacterium]|nr:hypothetical protein [Candidatus Binataceae bacterium]
MFSMVLFAVAAFAANLIAVAITFGTLILERRLGLGRGVALDAILIMAASYGFGAWLLGRALVRRFSSASGEISVR